MQARLIDLGFERVSTVTEPGEFAPRGGILDFFPAAAHRCGWTFSATKSRASNRLIR